MLRKTIGPVVTACVLLTACSDAGDPIPTSPVTLENHSEGRGIAHRLYAIGTSISAGTCSDGNVGTCQSSSWVAQVIRAMHHEPTLPLISGAGCRAPFALPLITFKRTSGESVATPDATVLCSPNESGITLPSQNLAIPGATTQDALTSTPESKVDPYPSQLYRRFLPLGESQVSAMEKKDPKFVTVELGANDVFNVLSGVAIAGATFVPFAAWAAQYNTVLDRVGAVTKQALLVGLGRDISTLSSLRRGGELWADRAAFLATFNVEVSADCDASENLIVVPLVVPAAVANGLTRRALQQPPFVLSCTAGPGHVPDRILTPAEVSVINAHLTQMSNHVATQAAQRGYAVIELDVLYGLPKVPFSVVDLMTTAVPYGPKISADGLHPSAAGQTVIANAALDAIDGRYNLGLNPSLGIGTSPTIRFR